MNTEKQDIKPLVSIVTGTYNSSKFIGDCVKSINDQTYKNIEHIIIDGNSKDNTVSIIEHMPNRVSKLISEKDDGIYDAMNKGLKLADGEILGILNSDDFYNSEEVIQNVVEAFEDPNIDCVYGDLVYVEQLNTDKVVRNWITGPYKENAFRKGWHPAHPSFFVRNSVYKKLGYFNLNFGLAADFELMLRFLEGNKIKGKYIPSPMVRMRLGGATNKSLKNILQGNKECVEAFKANDLKVSAAYPVYRLLPKLKQFLK
ncbi:glycosyltransferase family 2 protein [Maribacter sp. SA7]|uniref:glycosyltransferase family 2 protein n=1 Tax=Maribacter TaxID=252356 RepID=UPI0023EBF819|nr:MULTISPECIES: glycosyltransferase family 2 protein [Maribacter]MDF4204141.1 glycosyltransferase family 2 protein [Maribacter zhoushanensis]